jgi:hypothetical protein
MVDSSKIASVSRDGRGSSARFYTCVTILLLAAVGMQVASGFLGTYFRKAPLPLKRSLDLLDQDRLWPEYVLHRSQPKLLSQEEVDNLGTAEYLQWKLVDRQRAHDDPTSVARLFITYHTGGPSLVPHYPEQCLAASGMELAESTTVTLTLPGPHRTEDNAHVKVLTFEFPHRGEAILGSDSSERPRLIVAYFFVVNGRYATTGSEVRRAVTTLRDRYAYYSKIEVSFSDDSVQQFPNREQVVNATRRLLDKLMPILWEDHLQDWKAIQDGVPPVTAG